MSQSFDLKNLQIAKALQDEPRQDLNDWIMDGGDPELREAAYRASISDLTDHEHKAMTDDLSKVTQTRKTPTGRQFLLHRGGSMNELQVLDGKIDASDVTSWTPNRAQAHEFAHGYHHPEDPAHVVSAWIPEENIGIYVPHISDTHGLNIPKSREHEHEVIIGGAGDVDVHKVAKPDPRLKKSEFEAFEILRKAPLMFDAETHPEQKPYVELWRMQNDAGEGPYNPDSTFLPRDLWAEGDHDAANGKPGLRTDPGFTPEDKENHGQVHKFGFETPEHLNAWFTPVEQDRLAYHGFKPTKVKAKKVWTSGKQVFYEPYEDPKEEKLAATEAVYNFTGLTKSEHKNLCCMFLFDGVKHPDVLHVTHKYFKKFDDIDELKDILREYFDGHPMKEIKVTFDNIEMFGEDKNVKVLSPAKQKNRLFLLDLKEILDDIEADRWPEFKPHVAVSDNVDEIDYPIIDYVVVRGGKILWSAREEGLCKAEESAPVQPAPQSPPVQDWRSSYMQTMTHNPNPIPETRDILDSIKMKMLNEGKLIYNPKVGFTLNRRIKDRGNKNEPLMRAEPGAVKLVHYSNTPGLKEINPNFHGTGAADEMIKRTGKTSVPISYYYRSGTEEEPMVTQPAKSRYHSTLGPQHKLYDLSNDHQKLIHQAINDNGGAWNTENILGKIKGAGYHGFFNSGSSLPNVVALFHPHPVDKEEVLR